MTERTLDGYWDSAFDDLFFSGVVTFLAAGEIEKRIPGRQVWYDIALAALCDFVSEENEEPCDTGEALRFYREQVLLVETRPSKKVRKMLTSSALLFHTLVMSCREDKRHKRDFLVIVREIAIAIMTGDTRTVETFLANYRDVN